jgi:hypothetical protein
MRGGGPQAQRGSGSSIFAGTVGVVFAQGPTVVDGGNGGGGGRAGNDPCVGAGVGGAGGGAAIKFLSSLTPGNTLAVTVGAGGANTGGGGAGGGGVGVVMFEF